MQPSLDALYRAVVTSNTDSTNTGKIRVQCPQVAGSAEIRSAEPINPRMPVPNVNTVVWIGFNGGDVTKPFYVTNSSYVYLGATGVLQVNSPLIKANASWQTPSYNPNWLTSTTFNTTTGNQSLRFRLDIEDNLVIGGCFMAGGTLPSAAVFTLPVGYRPSATYWADTKRNNAATVTSFGLQITSAGVVSVTTLMGGGIAINNEYWVDECIVPLGNLS